MEMQNTAQITLICSIFNKKWQRCYDFNLNVYCTGCLVVLWRHSMKHADDFTVAPENVSSRAGAFLLARAWGNRGTLQSAPTPPVGSRHLCQLTVKPHILPPVWSFLWERGSTGAQGAAAGAFLLARAWGNSIHVIIFNYSYTAWDAIVIISHALIRFYSPPCHPRTH